MALDKAEWHSGGDFPEDLPPENGGTHIGMFLAWAIVNGLHGEMHEEESHDELEAVRNRQMTGRDFLFQACDGKFWEEDLSEEGNAFAAVYYSGKEGEGYGEYITDYDETLTADLPSTYHVEDTWANYDLLAPVIDRRYAEWRESGE
ncbi:hypothetical protein NA78x_004625 [Anatilimnocola sp. NA78]|uniref:DUF7832 domain-containing protein n=1 Tax=Anatilimnocola sp. NA78 TaxID=3415683 RepID=UPI003CE513E9